VYFFQVGNGSKWTELLQLLIEESPVDAKAAGGMRLLAFGDMQGVFDESLLPLGDQLMERQIEEGLDVPSAG
jgi:hypothetical protein